MRSLNGNLLHHRIADTFVSICGQAQQQYPVFGHDVQVGLAAARFGCCSRPLLAARAGLVAELVEFPGCREPRISSYIRLVVAKQVELNLVVARTVEEMLIECIAFFITYENEMLERSIETISRSCIGRQRSFLM